MKKNQPQLAASMAGAFQRGDEKALSYFYLEFHPALSLYANKLLNDRSVAEEIASESLLKTWKMHYKLHSYGEIRAYLYQVLRRDCLRAKLREKKLKKNRNKETIPVESPFDILLKTETVRLLHTALQALAPGSRRVLILHYLDGKTTGEIADELQLHPSTIKTQKIQGLAMLRKLITHLQIILSAGGMSWVYWNMTK